MKRTRKHNKNNRRMELFLEVIAGIAIAALGAYLENAHFQKQLPFGLTNDYLYAIWSYAGFFIATIVFVAGLYLMLHEAVDYYIDETLGWKIKGSRK